jgi:hypothetical protein
VVIGARTEAQLVDNLAAANLALSSEERSRLDSVSLPRLLYPYWHQANTAKERLSAADLSLLRLLVDYPPRRFGTHSVNQARRYFVPTLDKWAHPTRVEHQVQHIAWTFTL